VRRNPHTEAEEPADAIIEPIAVEALNERLHATSVTPELDDAPPAAMRWSSIGSDSSRLWSARRRRTSRT